MVGSALASGLGGFPVRGCAGRGLVLIWRVAVAPFHGNIPTANVMVGALALTGVLVTAAVSAVGLSLKQSIDRRTLELSQAEHSRQQAETAMQTVRLMALDSGNPAPKTQVSAALLVLAKLGEVSLAVDLVAEMWPKNQLTSSVAVRIVSAAFTNGDPPLQREAAVLLLNNIARLDIGDNQYEWPTYLDSWPAGLDAEARGTVALAVAEWIHKRKPTYPNDFRVRLMREALECDSDPAVRKVATALMGGNAA